MKLTAFLLLISILQVSAKAFSQTTFNINKSNITLQQLFDEVENSSDYSFTYRDELINTSEKVSVNVSEASINFLLDQAFANKRIAYIIYDTNIVLSQKPEPAKVPVTVPQAAQVTVSGTVRDTDGNRLGGVTVMVVGTQTASITGTDGEYAIRISGEDSQLQFSFSGFTTQTVTVGKRTEVNITMTQEAQRVDDVVVVGYGKQKKASVVGSVQSINVDNLRVPSSSLTSSFAGQLAGVVAVQRSGEPGADGADFWIRGISTFTATGPLIVIDGVKGSTGDLNTLDPEMIESFSILKDATATALYGSRGANGVMIVTTKSGRDLNKPHINIRMETSYSMPTNMPRFVNGIQYMEMYNEALANRDDKTKQPYSLDKIHGTRIGADPYVFPNVNWYDEMFRKGAMSENFNVSVRGGGRKMDYFSSVSFHNDNGMLKNSDLFSYNNNLRVQRYVIQNNINMYVTNTTLLTVKINGTLQDYHGPHNDARSVFGMVMNGNPVDFPIRFPDDPMNYDYIIWGGKRGGPLASLQNPYAEMARGYKDRFESTVLANVELNQKLDFVTEGLSASALFSFKNWSSTTTSRSAGYNQFEVTNYVWNEDSTAIDEYSLRPIGAEKTTVLGYDRTSVGDRQIYLQGMINYDRTFGEKHNVTGMVVYTQESFNENNPDSFIASLPRRKQGIAGRLTYSYDFRYLFEANFGYNGSENFAEGHRFGFFPSIGVGYVISREKFFEPITHIVSNLKLRATWGLVGNDYVSSSQRYVYLSDIELQNGNFAYRTGREQNVSNSGPNYKRFGNPGIQWEVGRKINLGLDLGMFSETLNISLDFFQERRDKIFLERQSVPDILGFAPRTKWINQPTVVYGNLGVVDNRGFDMSADYFRAVNRNFRISFKGTFTFAKSKVLEYDEPDFQLYPNLSKVGHNFYAHQLYVADRLFIDEAEVEASPTQAALGGVKRQAGDIKYMDIADVNGNYDGVINASDRVFSKYSAIPEIIYGFGSTMQYKKWDFSFFFQGATRVQIMMSGIHPFGTDNSRNVQQYIADNYWTADNPNIYAAYPRLSLSDNPNNTVASTYWLRDGSFLKLKSVELGFNLRMMRVYFRGINLLTFSGFKHWDPEQGSGNGLGYPTQMTLNLGIQFSFNK